MYSQLSGTRPNLVRLQISKKVTAREYEGICTLISERIKKRGAVDLLCELDPSFRRVSVGVFWKGAFLAAENAIKLRHVAVVGERRAYKWARVLVRGFHADTRYFEIGQRTRAVRWLDKGPWSTHKQHPDKFTGDASYRIERKR
ncbi:MAG TPA: STAS/SEC14 domain-containing protein [Candidatus Udaeobacter sp.]|nr:STAS/SEC14 domain-containing protein [Candidatus Udaeobacter sp.]